MISFRSLLPVAAAVACAPSTRHESQVAPACSAAAAAETVWGGVPGPGGSVVLEVSALAEDGRRRGPTDLWMAQRRNREWTEPRPLGGGLVFVRDFSSVHLVTLAAAAPTP